jgi:hypothetical protein
VDLQLVGFIVASGLISLCVIVYLATKVRASRAKCKHEWVLAGRWNGTASTDLRYRSTGQKYDTVTAGAVIELHVCSKCLKRRGTQWDEHGGETREIHAGWAEEVIRGKGKLVPGILEDDLEKKKAPDKEEMPASHSESLEMAEDIVSRLGDHIHEAHDETRRAAQDQYTFTRDEIQALKELRLEQSSTHDSPF